MFEQIGPMHVRSSLGFEVKCWRRATQLYLEYREGDHVLRYDNTLNLTGAMFPILPGCFGQWLPPFANEELGKEKQKRLIENVASALDFLGISTEVWKTGECLNG